MRYSGLNYPLQEINGNLYEIIAEWPFDRIKDPKPIKDWLGCTDVFRVKSQSKFIFCNQIQEVQYEEL